MKRDPDIHDTDARDFELFLKGGEPVKEEEEDEEAIFQDQEKRARLKEDADDILEEIKRGARE